MNETCTIFQAPKPSEAGQTIVDMHSYSLRCRPACNMALLSCQVPINGLRETQRSAYTPRGIVTSTNSPMTVLASSSASSPHHTRAGSRENHKSHLIQ